MGIHLTMTSAATVMLHGFTENNDIIPRFLSLSLCRPQYVLVSCLFIDISYLCHRKLLSKHVFP